MPYASSRSIHAPDSRVSRPERNFTGASPCRRARTSAAPMRRTVGASRGNSPALPRTPSVPNRRAIVLLTNPDSDFHRIDTPDADARRQRDAHGNLVLTSLEAGHVNRCVKRPGVGAHG